MILGSSDAASCMRKAASGLYIPQMNGELTDTRYIEDYQYDEDHKD
jgi:hypothetical protein